MRPNEIAYVAMRCWRITWCMVSSVLLIPSPRESIEVHLLPSEGGNPIKWSPDFGMDCRWPMEVGMSKSNALFLRGKGLARNLLIAMQKQ